MMNLMSPTLEAIRQAIEASSRTRAQIARESGVTEGQLSRLMSGERGMRIETIEKLAQALGLEITLRPKRRTKDK